MQVLQDYLNDKISFEEVNGAIRKLKPGKAAGEDCIMNEFLMSTSTQLKMAITHLFNQCLEKGVYPWNVSLITPLHKKGDRYNPDNYRAIAVGSAVGKLFSNILLERLVRYRQENCPDPPNQLGFCKEAQTADHIFTLTTCVNKYLHLNKRLYSCFIDYRKAFDTVSREALLIKLSKLGIAGRYFNCIKHMYTNSRAKIKLLDKLSSAIDVTIGTEQGHPMSPELFKIFLLDLSADLNDIEDVRIPCLNDVEISHLLWADDLVLLALDSHSLQTLINHVYDFCCTWGLTVNISKTAVLIFNKNGRLLKDSSDFHFGDTVIPSDRSYCYLGITLTLSGSLTRTMDELRKKGLRAYFSLKNLVDISELTVKTLFKLFDALILPVVSYGCQVWLPSTWMIRLALSKKIEEQPTYSVKKISSDPIENLHLKFLKWTLGVHRKTSNAFCWGDSGRAPLTQKLAKLAVDYYERLEVIRTTEPSQLVGHAFEEQKKLNLPWFERMSALTKLVQDRPNGTRTGAMVRDELQTRFENLWRKTTLESSKLKFYNSVKSQFKQEPYLDIDCRTNRKILARLRASAHRLNIETARYDNGKPSRCKLINDKAWRQSCKICTGEHAELLHHLPFTDPIVIEDERHVLAVCPAYQHLRDKLSGYVASALDEWSNAEKLQTLYEEPHVKEFGSFVRKVFETRFPKKTKKSSRSTEEVQETQTP